MATHFSTLAWKIPWTEEPGRLQSTGSLRVMNRTLENGTFYVMCVLPQYLKNPCWKQKQTKTM